MSKSEERSLGVMQVTNDLWKVLHRAKYEYDLMGCEIIGILEIIKSSVLNDIFEMNDEEDNDEDDIILDGGEF